MKKVIASSLVLTSLLSMSGHAKTVVCNLTNHSGESSVEVSGPYRKFSQVIIDTELKNPGTDQAYIDVKYKNGNDLLNGVLLETFEEGYNSQKITKLNNSKVRVISKSYFNKEIFDLNLEDGTLNITVKKNLNIGMIALTPMILNGSKSTYSCSESND